MKTLGKNKGWETKSKYNFKNIGSRRVEGRFDGGEICSDGGGILLREVEKRFGIIKKLADCFTDYRDYSYTEHSVYDLLSQRIFGIALGYEDLNDHEDLRRDFLFSTIVGKTDPAGTTRRHAQDKGCALAGKSTLNRLELSTADANSASRYKKIAGDFDSINRLFLEYFFLVKKVAIVCIEVGSCYYS